jgi:hypothetical protein
MQAQQALESATEKAEEYSSIFGTIKGAIVEQFGPNGLIAAYIVISAIILVLLTRLTKITFSTLKYLVIPATALAFIGTFFLPYSFVALLPVTVTGCSLIFLFKG